MMRSKQSKGFTLVELNIAIVFVALLLLAVATTIMSVTRTYQYGVSLKTINQLGREVADQIRRDAMMASPSLVQYIEPTDPLDPSSDGIGRLCFGNVSYVFNTAASLSNTDPVPPIMVKDNSDTPEPISLVRINDFGKAWCNDLSKVQLQDTDTYNELLLNDNIPVAIHSLTFKPLVGTAADAAFAEEVIQITFDIGTNEVETTEGGQCKPPTDPDQNFDNCAVRQFVIVARTAGG
jgi:type II secretory pathway pseudopilin PulG